MNRGGFTREEVTEVLQSLSQLKHVGVSKVKIQALKDKLIERDPCLVEQVREAKAGQRSLAEHLMEYLSNASTPRPSAGPAPRTSTIDATAIASDPFDVSILVKQFGIDEAAAIAVLGQCSNDFVEAILYLDAKAHGA
ncbi:Aste57867_18628 [Aphanomyces stellatus]|uniref:Aste57867_18628 protein n=1 Tax=Aphanomyces stellatus TaxID=120398 RepID=A0A485LAM0_9STRA|nr:hypothetical protein As57867_018566 [Aphanomyces stellatus]VFT95363.1 Aste57867_18628 [Aphanomyces stellatus]